MATPGVRLLLPGSGTPQERPLLRRLRPFPALDGLRGLAVTLVVAFHLLLPVGGLPGGFLGVDVFFVLSGFLITSLVLRSLGTTGSVDLRAFYARRARRLLPALAVVLVPLALAGLLLWVAEGRTDVLLGVFAGATYWSNWLSLFDPTFVPVFHLWSLSIEEQYYLVWPVAIAVAVRSRLSTRAILLGTLALAAASAGGRAVSGLLSAPVAVSYDATPFRLDGILLGSALAMVFAWSDERTVGALGRVASRMVVPCLALLALLALTLHQYAVTTFAWGMALGSVCAGVLVASIVLDPAPGPAAALARWTLGRRPLRWAGRRSYAVYLYTWPLQSVAPGGPAVRAVLTLAVALPLAELSYRMLERPTLEGTLLAHARTQLARMRTGLR